MIDSIPVVEQVFTRNPASLKNLKINDPFGGLASNASPKLRRDVGGKHQTLERGPTLLNGRRHDPSLEHRQVNHKTIDLISAIGIQEFELAGCNRFARIPRLFD